MLFYTDFACAVPFPHNIEGFLYMKKKYLTGAAFKNLQFEIILYSLTFSILASWLLF